MIVYIWKSLLWGLAGGLSIMVLALVFYSAYFIITSRIVLPTVNEDSLLSNLRIVTFEEFLFRYIVFMPFTRFEVNFAVLVAAVLISSLAFAFWHFPFVGLSGSIDLFLGGIVLCVIFLNAGLIASILAHLLRNYLTVYIYGNYTYPYLVRLVRKNS